MKLNRRAVVPTLVDDGRAIPESNVICEYLDEAYPERPLRPKDPHGKALMRLWTKQLDEDIHDAGIAVSSFAVAFRHQYLEQKDGGKELVERVPTASKREKRRDVVERGLDSSFVTFAMKRLEALFCDMDAALAQHAWLVGNDYSLADLASTPYLTRIEHLNLMSWLDRRPALAGWSRARPCAPELCRRDRRWRKSGPCVADEIARRRAWPKLQAVLASRRRARGR